MGPFGGPKTVSQDDHIARASGLSSLIGNTPVLAIDRLCRGGIRTVYAKAENLNLTGSIKDRMAFHILRRAYGSREPRSRRRPEDGGSSLTGDVEERRARTTAWGHRPGA